MRAEVIAIGSEILLGDIVNTNAAWISRKLALMGIDVYHHVTVGDNPDRIKQVIQQALGRSELLIFTGGLGPTDDDLTVETIANHFDQALVVDKEAEDTIKNYFITRDMPMSKSNVKQAKRPADAQCIKNPVGTAPGLFWNISQYAKKEAYVMAFPGVPKELFAMWDIGTTLLEESLPIKTTNQKQLVFKEFMHFFGIGESKVGEILSDLMQSSNPSVAPYVGQSSVRVRMAAKATSEEEALQLFKPIKQEIKNRLADYYFGTGENVQMEETVGALLKQNKLTVSVAESCTGGLVSHRLTNIFGSSAYTHFNAVTYSNEQKNRVLGVPTDILNTCGAVSEETAKAMALGIQKLNNSTIGLSLTGIAGPDGGSDEKPVGLVYIGLCGLTEDPIVKKVMVNARYDRSEIKHWFSQCALHHLRLYINNYLSRTI